MTPHPQRCIHYDACWFVHQHSRCPDDEPTEYEKSLPDCRFDTRPHTPAAPAERLCDDCNIIELEEKLTNLEHQIKDEREQVLTAIDDCATTDGEWIRFDGTDFLYLNYTVLSKKIESLRGGAP